MKKLLFLILLPIFGHSQTTQQICVQADCRFAISAPTDSISLNCVATSPDGIKSLLWVQLFGPGPATIVSPAASSTMARKLQPGTYVFQVTAITNKSLTGIAMDTVIVNALPPIKTILKIIQTVTYSDGTTETITRP